MTEKLPSYFEYLNDLKTRYTPKNILDIGAFEGEFSKVCKYLWNDVNCFMIEANTNWEHQLKLTNIPYVIECLGDSEREVEFFNDPNDLLSSGYSYYKENTKLFQNPVVEKKTLKRLDSLVEPIYDFIKIDTQGSELDIIKGGETIFSSANVVVIECCLPTMEYNIGGATLNDIMVQMQDLGFNTFEPVCTWLWNGSVFGDHYTNGFPMQCDVMFSK